MNRTLEFTYRRSNGQVIDALEIMFIRGYLEMIFKQSFLKNRKFFYDNRRESLPNLGLFKETMKSDHEDINQFFNATNVRLTGS